MWPALKEGSVVSCLLEPLKSLFEAGLYHLALHSIKPGVGCAPISLSPSLWIFSYFVICLILRPNVPGQAVEGKEYPLSGLGGHRKLAGLCSSVLRPGKLQTQPLSYSFLHLWLEPGLPDRGKMLADLHRPLIYIK